MRLLRLSQGVPKGTKRIFHRGLGVATCIAITVMPILTWARGGYGPRKPPSDFTRQELMLIARCRAMTQADVAISALFVRQCFAVRPYIFH